MAYAYLLTEYDDLGIEEARVTLTRGSLVALLTRPWKDATSSAYALAALVTALADTDADLVAKGPIKLSEGWGGIQFTVVEISA